MATLSADTLKWTPKFLEIKENMHRIIDFIMLITHNLLENVSQSVCWA